MVLTPKTDSLRASLRGLRQQGVAPEVAAPLAARQHAFVAELSETITDEVPAYRQSGNPGAIPELDRHLGEIVACACRLLAGEAGASFNFVSEHARLRAAQKFPLDAILHAYRGVHRMLLRWIRDAALEIADESAHVRRVVAAVSDFTAEYTGTLATLLTSEYVEHTRALAEAEGDRRTRLMDTLLRGYDESDPVAARLLRRAGYLEQRQSYCIAVARSIDPREMENPARAQRMADSIADVLTGSPLRQLIGVRDNHVVAIISGTRRISGWTAPQTLVADRVYPLLRQVGPAALIGLSNDVPSTSHIPRAASQARLALDFANVANRVMLYSDIPFRQVLVTHARDGVQSALPAWLDEFTAGDRKSRGALTATLRAYADADMNALRAAKALGIHPNTLYARMRRIRDLAGLDPLNYHALTEMLLACECAGDLTI
jgi:hypothetical protein